MTSTAAMGGTRAARTTLTAWRLRRFIANNLLEEPFDGRDPLAAGALDSLAIEKLNAYIDATFEIVYDDT